MKDKKFSEKIREAQIKLQIKTQADMAEKLGIQIGKTKAKKLTS